MEGWQGVWEPAKQTENNQDGFTGRSGGVAILTWNGRLLMKNTVEADYRALGVSIGWGRKKTLHIFSIYGFDTGQHINRVKIITKEGISPSEIS
eukprot:11586403-Heterocapsa_arctica.AAC.1